jgi:hypothetical protein
MPSQTLSVTVPPRVLTQIRKRAQNAKRTVEDEIVSLLADAVANGMASTNGEVTPGVSAKSEEARDVHRLLAEAEANLAPDIKEAIDRIEKLDDNALRKAVRPILKPKQAKRLEALNRKAQDDGLTGAEERERDELLHVYKKSMVVRAAALAELHKRGFNVSEFLTP